MPIVAVKEWSFETMDYNKYHHVINQERINWFALNYNFSSEYKLPSERHLHLTSFSSMRLELNEIDVVAILVYNSIGTKCPYYLEIFPDKEKFWKTFNIMFDIYVSADEKGSKALKYLTTLINNCISKK